MKTKQFLTYLLLVCTLFCLFSLAACDGEKTPPAEPVLLYGEGAPTYTLVRGDTADPADVDALIYLKKYLGNCGFKVEATTDWEQNPVSAYEIVVGETLRAESDMALTVDARDMGPEGWFVAVAGKRIYLCGGTPAATMGAVEHFLTEFFGYTGDADTGVTLDTVTVPGDYLYENRQKFAYDDYICMDVSLRDFRITADDSFSSYEKKSIIKTVQNCFYDDLGIWMEADPENTGGGPTLVVKTNPEDARGKFSVCADAATGNLVLSINTGAAFDLGWSRFAAELNPENTENGGVYAMDETYTFSAGIGDVVRYSDFGAVGDGKTDDLAAIAAAHEYANEYGLPVRADEGTTYYIASWDTSAIIQTDTDWTGASFILDDREIPLDKRGTVVFDITPTVAGYNTSDYFGTPDADGYVLREGQENVGFTLDSPALIVLIDSATKRYIREGVNANDGSDQQEIIYVNADGTVDPMTPVIWDYKQVTSVKVYPVDETTITVKGGTFTTIVADNITDPTYYNRGIRIRRSNVVVENLTHYVENETAEIGAPYGGIFVVNDCANVTIRNCTMTPHYTFRYKLADGTDFTQGTYDITPSRALNLTMENCTQTVDILDSAYWGVIGSNFCKNMKLDGCTFSRVDAHQGVANLTVLNSTLGHQCASVIGKGTLLFENCTFYGYNMINLRSDYGSFWDGELIVRNCSWMPNCGKEFTSGACVIGGSYTGYHDFGYECCMPHTITIDGLYIDDSKNQHDVMFLLGNIIPACTDAAYDEDVAANGYPYGVVETLTAKNITLASGKKIRLSANTYLYRDVEYVHD